MSSKFEIIEILRHELNLSPALAMHLYALLTQKEVPLPRMEVYRLRRALRKHEIMIISSYSSGYYLLPEDRLYLRKYFKISEEQDV